MDMTTAKANVLVLYTGGTIGMCPSEQGYQPVPGYLGQRIAGSPQFTGHDLPTFDLIECSPLLDSANMQHSDWNAMTETLAERYEHYDGFVILHGTDTMAFSASALSFMLEGLNKAVIFTGSQIPLAENRSDAQENLLATLMLLNRYHDRLKGVFLYFNHELMLGNRCTKISADSYQAFSSPNFPPIAKVGIHMNVHWELIEQLDRHSGSDLKPQYIQDSRVGVLKLFPGFDAQWIAPLLNEELDGLILECYGAGNAPGQNTALINALSQAATAGIIIVAVTQPLYGTADLSLYATGQALEKAGVISGYDMTTEAAFTKLKYVLSKEQDAEAIRNQMSTPIRTELTVPGSVRPDIVKQAQSALD